MELYKIHTDQFNLSNKIFRSSLCLYLYSHMCVNVQQYVSGLFILQTKLILLGFAGVYLILLNLRSISLHICRNYAKFVIIKYLLTGLC
jgi:hypothetical protein